MHPQIQEQSKHETINLHNKIRYILVTKLTKINQWPLTRHKQPNQIYQRYYSDQCDEIFTEKELLKSNKPLKHCERYCHCLKAIDKYI